MTYGTPEQPMTNGGSTRADLVEPPAGATPALAGGLHTPHDGSCTPGSGAFPNPGGQVSAGAERYAGRSEHLPRSSRSGVHAV